jgi:hypothetical protein
MCGRRRQPVAGAAFDLPDAHLRADLLALHSEPREGVLRVSAAARIRPGGRVPGAGPVSVLRVLGSLAGAHVLPDRHLGPRPAHLRRGEVLPVHHGRLGADAGGHHLPLQSRADVQLPGHSGHELERPAFVRARRADAALPGLLRRLRHQGAALPAAHLAAGRARGSAHGRLRDAGLRHAEDGHLRNSALLPAAVSRRGAPARPGSWCWRSSAFFTARWWPWCSPT